MKKIIITYIAAIAVLLGGMYLKGIGVKEEDEKISVLYHKTGKTATMSMDEFVTGVVAGEMPAEFHIEALKAQAVAARTYSLYKMKKSDKGEHCGTDICDNPSHCCAYYSEQQLKAAKGEEWIKKYYSKIKESASATSNEYMEYEKEPILAVFHSAAANGKTENSGDVWIKSLPYLKSVETEGEKKKTNYISTVTYSKSDFIKRLEKRYPQAYTKEGLIGEKTLTEGGAVDSITLGGIKLKGTEVRSIFGLKSASFDIIQEDNNMVFEVKGAGHGVGMSQYGANYMAEQGGTYKEILSRYYSGIEIVKLK